MPSKRTSDYIDGILEELNRQQAQDTVRAGATDQQVNDILRGLGISDDPVGSVTTRLDPIAADDMPTAVLDPSAFSDKLEDFAFAEPTPEPAEPSATAASVQPRAPRQQPAASAPAQQERKPAPGAPVAKAPAAETKQKNWVNPSKEEPPIHDDNFTGGDITQSGEIKNFLKQALQEQGPADATDIVRRKEQFKDFFKNSVAVIPDEKGRLHQPGREDKRRGLFARDETAEGTEEFVPINVALNGAADTAASEPETEPAPRPEENATDFGMDESLDYSAENGSEYGGGTQPDVTPTTYRSNRGKKKNSLFGGFGKKKAKPARRSPEPMPTADEAVRPATAAQPTGGYRSKYAGTRRVHSDVPEDTQASLEALAAIIAAQREERKEAEPQADSSHTGVISLGGDEPVNNESTLELLRAAENGWPTEEPKKKKDTVEFLPDAKQPTAQMEMATAQTQETGPVGEPVMPQKGATTGGFSLRMEPVAENTAAQTAPHARIQQPDLAALGFAADAPQDGPVPVEAPEQPEQPEAIPTDETHTFAEQPAPRGGIAMETDAPEDATRTFAEQPASRDGAPTSEFAASLTPEQPEQPETAQFVNRVANTIDEDEDTAAFGPETATGSVTGKFDKAAETLTEDLTHTEVKRGLGSLRFGGKPSDEEDAGTPSMPFTHKAARTVPDYEKAEDVPAVKRILENTVLMDTVAVIVSGIVAVLLLYLGTAAGGSTLPMFGLDPLTTPVAVLMVCLLLLVVAAGLNWKVMLYGLQGLVGSSTAETMPAMATVAAVVQLLAFLVNTNWYDPKRFYLMAGPAALLLCFAGVGRMLDSRSVRDEFSLISSGADHAAAYRLRDVRVVHAVTDGLGEAKPCVMVSRPTMLLKNFLPSSGAHRTSDKNQQQFAWVLGVAAIICLLFNLAWYKDPGAAVSSMAAVICMSAPLAGVLISALPARLMQRSAARVGAVIPGWKDIRQLGRTNVIQVTSGDLFPAGCVQQHGIKTFNKERIDLAITYAASMLADSNSTLRDEFLHMIGDNRKMLHKVDELKCHQGLGYVGWIEGDRVILGNRTLMEQFGVDLPAIEYEERYAINQRKMIYLAVSGSLSGMFLMGYVGDPDTAAVLEGLRSRGISLIVTSDDFNCDAQLIESIYSLPAGSVKVLGSVEQDLLAPSTAWLPESEGSMMHMGSFASFVGGLEAAAGAAEGEHRASIVLTVSVLLSCVVSLIMSMAGQLASLALPVVVVYQVVWCLLALVFPLIQKY